MPAPTIPDTWRVVLGWEISGSVLRAVNVMHFINDAGTALGMFQNLEASVTAEMWQWVTGQALVTTVGVQRLDGTSAAQEFATDQTAKWIGSGSNDAILQGAGLIKHTTLLAGRSNRGRTYIPYVAENKQTNGGMVGVAAVQEGWTDFLNAMADTGYRLAVASYTDLISTDVVASTAQSQIATQRRRNKR